MAFQFFLQKSVLLFTGLVPFLKMELNISNQLTGVVVLGTVWLFAILQNWCLGINYLQGKRYLVVCFELSPHWGTFYEGYNPHLESFSKRIFLCTLMTTDFIEFQTNEWVSDHKETIIRDRYKNRYKNRVQLLFPRRFGSSSPSSVG